MLNFFPNPYPDELLYSVFARYHIRSGNLSPKMTIEDLFSNRKTSAVVDLPSSIDALVNNLPNNINKTSEDFIYNNTLYPIYEPFLPAIRSEKVKKSMKGSNGGDIHCRIGIMASSVENSKYLKYCPFCNKNDIYTYGELYWHRLFQIPGVIVCPKHNTLLLDSSVSFHSINKHDFIAAGEENCIDPGKNAIEINYLNIEKYLAFSKDVEWILNNKPGSRNIEWFYSQYKNLLISKGYANINGRVDQKSLIDDFVNFYSDEVLKTFQSEVNYDFENNWLSSIARKPRKVFHPIRHLLLIRFLSSSIEEFFREKYTVKPFGNPPWPCLNYVSGHYHEAVIRDVIITYDNDTKQPVGTFYCECGFVYSRRGPDKDINDRYRIGRIKSFGTVWENSLKRLLQMDNLSLREIARRLNVDVGTVKKYSAKLAISTNNETERSNGISFYSPKKDLLNEHRNEWVELQNNNKVASKNELRNLNRKLYIWLYKNDKEWLNSNSPRLNKRKPNNTRVNWEQRDAETVELIKRNINAFYDNSNKPRKITVNRIGKQLGIASLLEKKISKLPETSKYLKRIIESSETFELRKIKWAAKELNNKGIEIKEWKLIKKAGLKNVINEKVKNEIEIQVNKYDEGIFNTTSWEVKQ